MAPLALLVNALPFLGGLFTRAKDSTDLAEKNQAAENQALRAQVTAEASRAPTTKWDSFVDGLNRLIRPLVTLGAVGLIVWACVDPISFSAAMVALQLVPENLWIIIGAIVVFWFGDRMLGLSTKGAKSAVAVSEVLTQIRQIEALQAPQDAPVLSPAQQADQSRRDSEKSTSGAQIAPETYERELADTSKPMSLPAIEEYNRRLKAQMTRD